MDPLVIAQIVLAAVQNVLFATATGVFAYRMMGKRSGLPEHAALRVRGAGLAAALAISALMYLWLEAAVMSGSPLTDAGQAVGPVLTASHFGLAWSVGIAGALVAASSGLPGQRGFLLSAAGLVAWSAGKAAASHAADSGVFSLRVAIHVIHLLATALWAGSVIVAAILLRQLEHEPGHPSVQRAAFCAALSYLATGALVLVLVTGFYNAAQDTARASAPLFRTDWGHVLATKLICVALATLLGGWNRMTVLPNLLMLARRGDPAYAIAQRRFDRVLAVEALVMLAVLALAAALGHISPTGG